MPQSGKVSTTVNNLLQRYKEHCSAERKRRSHSSECPAALLPVSFAQAKDWLLKQQKLASEPLQSGAVNEESRNVIADLNKSLSEQPPSTSVLLEQPAHPASPIILLPSLSLGPEAVTESERAEERAQELARKRPNVEGQSKKKPPPKKKKVIPPELEERQKRAAARMLELGVSQLQVMFFFCCSSFFYTVPIIFFSGCKSRRKTAMPSVSPTSNGE